MSPEFLLVVGGFTIAAFGIGAMAQFFAFPAAAIAATMLGLAGLAIYAGLRTIARAKRNEARRLETTRAALDLETRLHRHISRVPRPHMRRRPIATMDQYLPVARRGR
jgi:hypothetical protein